MNIRIAASLVILSAGAAAFSQTKQAPPLPRDLEIELALSAAPKHLREGATVLALAPAGYAKVKEGSNAFTCIVSRLQGDFFPVCFDAEGTRTMLPVYVDDAKLRLGGKSNSDIDRQIAEGFREGRYQAPARPGVAYMLSPMRCKIDEAGRITRTPSAPHIMFYAPNLTDADIGGARGAVAFVNRTGPHGMIIVPLGKQERDAIVAETRSLVEQVERQIGITNGPQVGSQGK
ncbi:MAG: hypothetical protein HYX25_10340 [Candidatus Solibacter usitatus]|nr:hypothetical protein [Candidatus Solibacter usitatus]